MIKMQITCFYARTVRKIYERGEGVSPNYPIITFKHRFELTDKNNLTIFSDLG